MVTSKQRNETVFENRNKEYGAYKIRKDYDKRILLIFLGFTVGVGALWGASNLFKPLETKKPPVVDIRPWTMDPATEAEKPEIPEPEVEKQAAAPTKADIAKFQVMEISDTKQDQNITPPDPNKNIGDKEQIGDPGSDFDPNKYVVKKGPESDGPIIKTTVDIIHTAVDEDAKFPGGLDALRKYIAENIDLDMIDGSSKVYLKFVVDTEGTISSVVVTNSSKDCESCEKAALKVVKGIKQKWTPAKINGEAVKSYFRLPITFQ